MSLPGIKFEVYAFLGKRNGTEEGTGLVEGYRIKLYDSSDPNQPIILNPLHEISENTAGTMTFILHRTAKATVYYKNASDQSTSQYPTEQKVKPFMYIKQTEIVIFRSVLYAGNTYVRKEIWAGRVTSIGKDFYGDWSITAEGDLSYLNDVTMNYERKTDGKKSTPSPDALFKDFITKYISVISSTPGLSNKKITNVSGLPKLPGASSPPVQSFPQINRIIQIGDCSSMTKENQVISATTANLDDGYTVSEGPVWGNLQVLLDRYGGHFEIVRSIENNENVRRLNWTTSGQTTDDTNPQMYIIGYHTYDQNRSQDITFGKNLLDYSEEVNGDDMFTVLIPHGSQKTETTTDENGNTKTTTGANITIADENNGSPRLYSEKNVNKYGFIEKIETWSISDPKSLKKVATAYYDDYRIGAFKITIKAYDLKNLLIQDPTDSTILGFDALYLYDPVKIERGEASDNTDLRDILLPIQGIRLPLDKFPTDTEFTISNAKSRRGILQPGTLQSKQEPSQEKNEAKDGTTDPEVIEEDPIPSINPWAHENGIDSDLPHYPPVYLDHAHNYWKGIRTKVVKPNSKSTSLGFSGIPMFRKNIGTIQDPDYESVMFNKDGYGGANIADILYEWKSNLPKDFVYVEDKNRSENSPISGSSFDYLIPISDTYFGYSEGTFTQGTTATQTQAQFNSVFYTDDLGDSKAYMRMRTSNHDDETITNWYEKAYKTAEPQPNPMNLDPFISASTAQYQMSSLTDGGKANITTDTGLWHNYDNSNNMSIADIEFVDDPIKLLSGSGSSSIISKISAVPCFGSTVGEIIGQVNGIGLRLYSKSNDPAFYVEMAYTGDVSVTKKISVKSINFKPSTFESGKEYYYAIGTRQINPSTMALYYMILELPVENSNNNTTAYKNKVLLENIRIRCGLKSLVLGKNYYAIDTYIEHESCGWTADSTAKRLLGGDAEIGNPYYSVEYDSALGIDVCKEEFIENAGNRKSLLYEWASMWDSQKQAAIDSGTYDKWPQSSVAMDWAHYVVTASPSPYSILKTALQEASQLLSVGDETVEIEYKKRLAFAKAYYNTAPMMIISKCTDTGTGTGDYYGVTFFEQTDDMTLTDNGNNAYTLNGVSPFKDISTNSNNKPYIICKDTLATANYLFGTHNNEFTIINSDCVPTAIGNTSPLMILGKCGGRHTARIADGLYMILSGPRYSSHVEVTEAISPISGSNDYRAPKERNERYKVLDGEVWKKWYYGHDMMTEKDIEDRNEWTIPISPTVEGSGYFNTSPEDLKKYYYYNSQYMQPVVIGSDKYVKITPNLYARLYTASETEGDS